jgi:DNA polymerase-3 subunit beta
MKFECSHEKIFSAISRAEKITGKHPTLPVLSCILCTATTDGRVIFRATNLHTGVEISVPAKVTTPGVCALPGSYFNQVLSGISEEEVILCETEGEVFHIQTKKTRTKLKTLPHDDFPELPKKNTEQEISIPVKDFINGIKSVIFAGSNSDIKPELSSIYIYGKDKQLCFVATREYEVRRILETVKIKLKDQNSFRIYDMATDKWKTMNRTDLNELEGVINNYYTKNPKSESFPMNKISQLSYGKNVLLNTSWNGRLDLTDPKRIAILEDYLRRK